MSMILGHVSEQIRPNDVAQRPNMGNGCPELVVDFDPALGVANTGGLQIQLVYIGRPARGDQEFVRFNLRNLAFIIQNA